MRLVLHPLSRLSRPQEVIRQFTPNWFTATMGTGILALMLAQFPFHVPGLQAISRGLWIANIALFALLSVMFVARWVFFPDAFRRMLTHSVQSMFLGAIPMGLATIVNGYIAFGLPTMGARALQIAYPLWWVDAGLAVLSGFLVPYLMFTDQEHTIDKMTAVWLLPIVPAEVAAATGGLIAPHVAPHVAALILVVSGILWSLSVPLALGVLVILFMRLALHNLPPRDVAVSGWLTLGPLGTGSLAMILLGDAAARALASTSLAGIAGAVHGFGMVVGLLLWGYGAWWWVMAILMTAHHAKRDLPFNMGWWAFTFPLGVYTAATLALARDTGSTFFLYSGALFVLMLAVLWILVMARTMHGAWHGYLFHAPCLSEETGLPINDRSNGAA